MVFGFNNFNMMNMFPMMNFGSFGFGSFGCGNGYSNFGSSLYGCGFANNYLNPINCNGTTNWGAVGFGLASTYAPLLLAGATRLVSAISQNSNKNQQEVVADDIQTLLDQKQAILDRVGKTENELNSFNIETTSEYEDFKTAENKYNGKISQITTYKNEHKVNNENIINKYEAAKAASKLDENGNMTEEPKITKEQYNAAKDAKDQYEDWLSEKENLKEDMDTKEATMKALETKIKKAQEDLKAKNEQIKNAQADLKELKLEKLDRYDSTKKKRSSSEDFKTRLNIDATEENYYQAGKTGNDITEGDVLYIINQVRTSTGETQKKYAKMLHKIWNDLDPDIKSSRLCLGGYRLICEDQKLQDA